MADAIRIPGFPRPVVQVEAFYDYHADKTKCPCCGGLGWAWRGWFSCENCPAIAVVDDGRVFMPFDRRASDIGTR